MEGDPIRVRDLDMLARSLKATVEMFDRPCAAQIEFSMHDLELDEPVDVEIHAWRCPNPDCEGGVHVAIDRVRRDRHVWNQERSDDAMFDERPE